MADTSSWLETLSALREARTPCAMVVVTEVRGSAPREVGARMVIAGGRIVWGTIGGGQLEHLAIARAAELTKTGVRAGESVDFPLSEKAGQCCGGAVTLFFDVFPWQRARVVVFGAGHVAQAIGGLAPWLSADVLLIDPREEAEIHPPLPRDASTRPYELLLVDAPEEEIDRLPLDSHVLVMTHSHALDLEIIARALKRDPFPYLGLIGSERKWLRFRERLAQRGFTEEQWKRVRCPIGATRTSKDPGAIALATAAELASLMMSPKAV
jgi:xanthine dehydrogenase accessory factor